MWNEEHLISDTTAEIHEMKAPSIFYFFSLAYFNEFFSLTNLCEIHCVRSKKNIDVLKGQKLLLRIKNFQDRHGYKELNR